MGALNMKISHVGHVNKIDCHPVFLIMAFIITFSLTPNSESHRTLIMPTKHLSPAGPEPQSLWTLAYNACTNLSSENAAIFRSVSIFGVRIRKKLTLVSCAILSVIDQYRFPFSYFQAHGPNIFYQVKMLVNDSQKTFIQFATERNVQLLMRIFIIDRARIKQYGYIRRIENLAVW